MNKVITTAAVILCLAGSANAGDARTSHGRSTALAASTHTVLIGADIDAALPLGTYGDLNGIGAGALLTIEYPMMEQLSLTGRAGFQFHADKTPPGAPSTFSSHVHSVPVLLGAKYYVMETNRQGLFAAAELGMFDLMADTSAGGGASEVKFGVGAGVGYQWNQWSARINVHSHDIGNFGDLVMVTGGVGYQFAGF
jgi:hypothetical protein